MEKNKYFKGALAALLFLGLILCGALTALADDQSDTYLSEFPDANSRHEVLRLLNEDGGSRTDGSIVNENDFYPQHSDDPPTGKDITASFKDPGFLAVVREIINKPEGPILDYDVSEISFLYLNPWDIPYTIYDLSGIEYFYSLTYLNCSYQKLTELDVSRNIALEFLYCAGNELSSLDVSHNTVLQYLLCQYNQLNTLDVSNNTTLEYLDCDGANLSTLDVSNNTALSYLDCRNNRLRALDVSQNTALEWLFCMANQLTDLDLSNNTALEYLSCGYNFMPYTAAIIGWQEIGLVLDENFIFYPQYSGDPPSGKDITASFKDAGFLAAVREIIHKPEGPIFDDDVFRISSLYLNPWDISYTIYDLSGIEYFYSLTYLNCSYQKLTELDVSRNIALEFLYCAGNELSSLDVSHNTLLLYLLCHYNPLNTLDVSNNTALEYLDCDGVNLSILDVSKNTALNYLDCRDNSLTALDVSKNTVLEWLFCLDNQLTDLDVSNNTALELIYCSNNYLASPDSVKGWRQLGLTINSPQDLESGSFHYYNQLISPAKEGITVNFPGIMGASVQYYTNVSGWQTVGKYDDTCQFVIPDNHRATWGFTTVQVVKDGMYYTFSNLTVGDAPLVLDVPIETITVIGIAAACDLAIVQNDWVYRYTPAVVGIANEFTVFGNGKKYEVRLYRPGFYPISITGVDAAQTTYFGPSYFYQVEVPAGVTNVWISSYDWAVRGANAGERITLLTDPNNIRDAKMSYVYSGKTYNVEFKLDGANPFDLI